MAYSEATLNMVMEAVAAVTRKNDDAAIILPEDELSLDSISRISLITELENKFDMEIPQDQMQPEIFTSMETIALFVEGIHR